MLRARWRHERSASCAEVREHLSAALDGEVSDGTPGVARHLRVCSACREFDGRVAVLTRRLRINALETVPDLTAQILGRIGEEARTATTSVAEEHRSTLSTPGLTRWALAIVPLSVALSSLAGGAFATPRIVPTHPVTPCIVSIVRHDRRVP